MTIQPNIPFQFNGHTYTYGDGDSKVRDSRGNPIVGVEYDDTSECYIAAPLDPSDPELADDDFEPVRVHRKQSECAMAMAIGAVIAMLQLRNREPYTYEAQRALAFARQHDWGENAYLVRHQDGSESVAGLRDVWVLDMITDTRTQVVIVLRPATLDAMRDFGNY